MLTTVYPALSTMSGAQDILAKHVIVVCMSTLDQYECPYKCSFTKYKWTDIRHSILQLSFLIHNIIKNELILIKHLCPKGYFKHFTCILSFNSYNNSILPSDFLDEKTKKQIHSVKALS